MNHNSRLERAWAHYMADRTSAAIQLLKELLGEDPNHAEYHSLLAACLLQDKRLHAAEYELGLALKIDPQMPFLYLLQSNILVFKNKFKQALAACDQALALAPEFIDALLKKAEILLLLNQYAEARSCLDQAARISPDNLAVTLAYADFHLTNGDIKNAETFALEALHQDAQNETANVLMGKIRLTQGNIQEAEYHAKFVILNNPNSEQGLALFSNIKARTNWFLGLWWRLNNKLANSTQFKQITYLICAYLFFNLLSQIVEDMGHKSLSDMIGYAWLGLVVYSWVAIPIYIKMLKKELDNFQFNRDF